VCGFDTKQLFLINKCNVINVLIHSCVIFNFSIAFYSFIVFLFSYPSSSHFLLILHPFFCKSSYIFCLLFSELCVIHSVQWFCNCYLHMQCTLRCNFSSFYTCFGFHPPSLGSIQKIYFQKYFLSMQWALDLRTQFVPEGWS
jgi:hypothetical protein